MNAAVVRSFDHPPRYETFPDPVLTDDDEILVSVLASGLHPRVRSAANGSHYTSTGELPLIPGFDGVGRTADGELLYFVLPDTTLGAMADQARIDRRRSAPLPDDADPIAIAAAMNPAMSSWIALRRRIDFQAGQRVLILGATGNAGQLAVQVAKHLGAGHVVATGRDPQRLAALQRLGADVTVGFDALGAAAHDVDVVIDYLWGEPAAQAMAALITRRTDRSWPLDWIQIGSVAGPTAAIPSAALRAANFRILGSGQGSVSTRAIVEELPALAAEITTGAFSIGSRAVPLSEVETTWNAPSEARVVFTP
jgi:NADPH:quinone reductase-like Zn-dependent oxidoreductase